MTSPAEHPQTATGEVLLIRADASPEMGVGHVMRCLALAEQWREAGGQPVFASTTMPAVLERRLGRCATVHRLADAPPSKQLQELVALGQRLPASWVVVDGYHLGEEHEAALRPTGIPVLRVDDDESLAHYDSAIILNQNLDAEQRQYHGRNPACRLLLGTQFALIRKEFTQSGQADSPRTTADRVLVTMGGSDPTEFSLRAVRALDALHHRPLHIVVVAGALAHEHTCDVLPAHASRHQVEVLRSPSMPTLMQWADVAVAAAGSTCWELAYMGVPMVAVATVPNQIPTAASLSERGVAAALMPAEREDSVQQLPALVLDLLDDHDRRRAMSDRGRRLVDGRGAKRVVEAMHDQRAA